MTAIVGQVVGRVLSTVLDVALLPLIVWDTWQQAQRDDPWETASPCACPTTGARHEQGCAGGCDR